jgi:dTDP-4-dehydrorhamnose reductase
MKLLLTGKNGQLGFELCNTLAPLGEVIAVGKAECDLRNEGAVRSLVQTIRPDVVVNAAAYTAVDKAESEPDLAYAINERAVGILGDEAEKIGAMVVHYSTDYVFDGTKDGFYAESDLPKPLGVYGASKLAGEVALAESKVRHLIFRTSWVFGEHGSNFVKTMLHLAAEQDEIAVVNDQFGAPTSAVLLAQETAHVLREVTGKRRDTFSTGLYHLAASGMTNWHEYAVYVIESARASGNWFRLKPEGIKAISSTAYPTAAKRPANSLLDTGKLERESGLKLPDWRLGVDQVLAQLN